MLEIYFAVSESTLLTSAVNDGRPSEPGAGWMTSAPTKCHEDMLHLLRWRKFYP